MDFYKLAEKEKIVLKMREDSLTLKAIGKHFGVTPERVRQIESKAKRKMKTSTAAEINPLLLLPLRPYHRITKVAKIETMEELFNTNPNRLLKIRNFGRKSLMLCAKLLKDYKYIYDLNDWQKKHGIEPKETGGRTHENFNKTQKDKI